MCRFIFSKKRTALFWVITQRVVVISYWRFGTTCRFYLRRSVTQKTAVLFWVITQRVVVISYWRFGTTCRFYLHRSITQNTNALFWVITQRVVVSSYWRFGTTCRFSLRRSVTQNTTVLFWVITQRVVVISYRRFGTTCRSHLQRSIQRRAAVLIYFAAEAWNRAYFQQGRVRAERTFSANVIIVTGGMPLKFNGRNWEIHLWTKRRSSSWNNGRCYLVTAPVDAVLTTAAAYVLLLFIAAVFCC
jgi:hypothetical protein